MKSLVDKQRVLSRGLAEIRSQFQVPAEFPPAATAEAERAAVVPISGHEDWTGTAFVTLDPQSSRDLDQAFAIEWAAQELILHYAIADVAWFLGGGDPLDGEAWQRGETIYMPDEKSSLYPLVLSEGAASLLPGVERPSVVFTIRIDPNGQTSLDGAVRAVIKSRSKLAYETVHPDDLPSGFTELSRRIEQSEDARGAMRVDAPQQELVVDAAGHYALEFRPQPEAEQQNAALSLAANLAIADALLEHRTGLFRVMAEPDERSTWRLRHTAKALGLHWPKHDSLKEFEKTLDATDPRQASFMTAVRRVGPGASYAPYRAGVVPWHSAMAATYAHATAPLRRLADRYVIEAALQVAAGRPVSEGLGAAFQRLPTVMLRADAKAGQVERAVLDLAEAIMLEGREGSRFEAIVTDVDERGTRIQLSNPAVVTRVEGKGAMPGDSIAVELVSVDVPHRQVKFLRVD